MPETSSNGISMVIETLYKILDLYDGSQQDVDCLPDSFRTVIGVAMKECDLGVRALDTLRSQVVEQTGFDLNPTLDNCQNKAQRLHQLLSLCFEGDPAYVYSRYVDQIRRLGKQDMVETLVLGILHGVQELIMLSQCQAATDQRQKLSEAIIELSTAAPSVPDDKLDANPYRLSHYGSGNQSVHAGTGHQGINSGGGEMYLGTNQTFNRGAGKDHQQL